MEKEKPDILKKELLDQAPGMSNAPKDNPFEVPKDYFENLPERIQQLKNSRAQRSHRTIWGYSQQKVLAYAAALAVLVSFGLSVFFLTHDDEINDFAGIDDDYYESYFSYIADYDEAHYYDIVLNEENDILDSEDIFFGVMWEEDMEEDDYLEYLLDNMDIYPYLLDEIADNN